MKDKAVDNQLHTNCMSCGSLDWASVPFIFLCPVSSFHCFFQLCFGLFLLSVTAGYIVPGVKSNVP